MGSELLLLITFPVVAKSDKSAELDTVNFIVFMFFVYIFRVYLSRLFSYFKVARVSSAIVIILST